MANSIVRPQRSEDGIYSGPRGILHRLPKLCLLLRLKFIESSQRSIQQILRLFQTVNIELLHRLLVVASKDLCGSMRWRVNEAKQYDKSEQRHTHRISREILEMDHNPPRLHLCSRSTCTGTNVCTSRIECTLDGSVIQHAHRQMPSKRLPIALHPHVLLAPSKRCTAEILHQLWQVKRQVAHPRKLSLFQIHHVASMPNPMSNTMPNPIKHNSRQHIYTHITITIAITIAITIQTVATNNNTAGRSKNNHTIAQSINNK